MKALTYSEYCKNKYIKASLGWMNNHYIYNGKLYTPHEIDKMFPTNGRLVSTESVVKYKGINPDKRFNYLQDGKSY